MLDNKMSCRINRIENWHKKKPTNKPRNPNQQLDEITVSSPQTGSWSRLLIVAD